MTGLRRVALITGGARGIGFGIADGLTLEPRWGYPDDIGRVAAAALRGDMPYSTGQVFTADGGFTIKTL